LDVVDHHDGHRGKTIVYMDRGSRYAFQAQISDETALTLLRTTEMAVKEKWPLGPPERYRVDSGAACISEAFAVSAAKGGSSVSVALPGFHEGNGALERLIRALRKMMRAVAQGDAQDENGNAVGPDQWPEYIAKLLYNYNNESHEALPDGQTPTEALFVEPRVPRKWGDRLDISAAAPSAEEEAQSGAQTLSAAEVAQAQQSAGAPKFAPHTLVAKLRDEHEKHRELDMMDGPYQVLFSEGAFVRLARVYEPEGDKLAHAEWRQVVQRSVPDRVLKLFQVDTIGGGPDFTAWAKAQWPSEEVLEKERGLGVFATPEQLGALRKHVTFASAVVGRTPGLEHVAEDEGARDATPRFWVERGSGGGDTAMSMKPVS
jgi:hypothetical protein